MLTRALVLAFIGYWIVFLPLAIVMTFVWGRGVSGIWWSVCVGLSFIGVSEVVVLLRTNWTRLAVEAKARGHEDSQVSINDIQVDELLAETD